VPALSGKKRKQPGDFSGEEFSGSVKTYPKRKRKGKNIKETNDGMFQAAQR